MTSLAEIKNWFKTDFKPTQLQLQLWLTWDSFWHKDESIPQANVLDLEKDLENKANREGGNTFTGKQTIHGNIEVKGNITSGFERYSSFGTPDTDNMFFEKNNLVPEYPQFEGLFFFTVAPDCFNINIQSENISVRLSVDGVAQGYVFTKNELFNTVTGYGPMWTMPALTGYNTIYLDGAVLNKSTPNSVKLNLPADTDPMGKFLYDNVVQVQPNGTLKAVAPVVPTIGAVLGTSGNTINAPVDFTEDQNHFRNKISGKGSVIKYNANDGSDNDRYASYTIDGIRFNSNDNSLINKYAVSVIPNISQGNSNKVDVILPKKSGYLPVKSELPTLLHRTIPTTAASLSDSQWQTLITPLDTTDGNYKALHTTLVYNGAANAIWAIPAERFSSEKYTVINNTEYTITLNRVAVTTFWMTGVSHTSVTIPAYGWAEIIGSETENRFYFKIF